VPARDLSAWHLGLAAALVAWGSARSAGARDAARRLPVELEVEPCTGVSPDVVSRVLTVELGVSVTVVAAGEASDPAQKPDTTLVSLACDEGTIRMSVKDPLTGKSLERHVDLRAERSSARPRLLALSAAELVAASWIELEGPPPPAPAVEATAPPPARVDAADAARATLRRLEPISAHWDVGAVGVGRRFSDANLTTWGAGIAGVWTYQDWLSIGGDILGEGGSGDVSHDGQIVGTASLFGGSLGLALRLRRGWPDWSLEAGVGARLALMHIKASANDMSLPTWNEHSFNGTWGGPMTQVRLGWKPSRGVLVTGAVEGGTLTRELTGLVAKVPDVVLTGSWVAVSLGVGLGRDTAKNAR
jgi:hypothetical protein